MRDLDLTSLRLFTSVCDARSIARVAEQESIVGSAISKRLAQLEHTVGTSLLVRRRRGVEPTPAGETLLEHARSMLAAAQSIERDMAAYAAGVRGQVRVLATASVMAESLADDVAAFLQAKAHQYIQVDLEERLSTEVVRGVRQGLASLGICWDAADLGVLQSRSYRCDHLAIVVHPSHPLAHRVTIPFMQTLAFDHVSLPVTSAVQVMLQRVATQMGQSVNYRVVVSNFESALRVVRANLAVSVVPVEVAQPYSTSLGLRIIPLTDAWAQRQFTLCYRDLDTLSTPARLLLEHLGMQASRQ